VLAIIVAPVAMGAGDGKPIKLGKRNPVRGAAKRTTQLVAKTKSGANTLKVTNTGKGGQAFQFVAVKGTLGGVIQIGSKFATPHPEARPFTTNATGVATGLNAERVDGLTASDIITQAQQTNPLAGAPSFAFARVAANGTTDQNRSQGVTNANVTHPGTGVHCFISLTSRPKNANVTLDAPAVGMASVNTTDAPTTCANPQADLFVQTYDKTGTATDEPFYISITGTTGTP
jgi:hypothetical protein